MVEGVMFMLSNVIVVPVMLMVGSNVMVKATITGSTGAGRTQDQLEQGEIRKNIAQRKKIARGKADGFRYRCCVCRFNGSSRCQRQRRRQRERAQSPTFHD